VTTPGTLHADGSLTPICLRKVVHDDHEQARVFLSIHVEPTSALFVGEFFVRRGSAARSVSRQSAFHLSPVLRMQACLTYEVHSQNVGMGFRNFGLAVPLKAGKDFSRPSPRLCNFAANSSRPSRPYQRKVYILKGEAYSAEMGDVLELAQNILQGTSGGSKNNGIMWSCGSCPNGTK
jgi:hypothetical protein